MCEISFWFMNFFSLLHNSKHLLLVFDIFHSFLSHIFFSSFNLLFFGLQTVTHDADWILCCVGLNKFWAFGGNVVSHYMKVAS